MGREEISWDDSIFIRAFNDAISKYKIMHGQETLDSSAEGGEVFNGSDKIEEPTRGGDEKSNTEANNVNFEADKTTNTSTASENISVEPCPISCADFSDTLHVKETQQESIEHSNLNLKGAEGYNQLLNQYYELEEKRQKVLEQLYQCGGCNYQDVSAGSGIEAQWRTSSTYQEYPVPASQTSQNHVTSSSWTTTYPIGPQSSSFDDGDFIRTAMDAAARAISSMKPEIPGDFGVNKEKERERRDGIMPQSASSETDLAAVLHAWYSAGFYTGKYLVEKSYAKK